MSATATIVAVTASLTAIALCIKAINDIIEQCNRTYDLVNQSLQRINSISGGQFTVNLLETGDKLKTHYTELISGMNKMLAAVQSVYDENKRADEQAANALKGANSKY